jgi:hypothetical protein
MLKGVVLTMFIWCCLVAWVARLALSRGRSAVVWALIAGAVGGLGLVAGLTVSGRMIWDSEDVNLLVTVVALFLPFVTLIVPMVIVGVVVLREPIKVASRGPWPVTFMKQGPGSISEAGGKIAIEYGGTRRELAPEQITRVEADGECLRLTIDGEDLVAMPMAKPQTPPGRRHQSLVLAKRLRMRPEIQG